MTTQPDPCLNCTLPQCDESDPQCPFYTNHATNTHALRTLRTLPNIPRPQQPRAWFRLTTDRDIKAANDLQNDLQLATKLDLALACIRWTADADPQALAFFHAKQDYTPQLRARQAPGLCLLYRNQADLNASKTITHTLDLPGNQQLFLLCLRWTHASDPLDLAKFVDDMTGTYTRTALPHYTPTPAPE